MPLPPEKVWPWLVRASQWAECCPGISWVRIEGGGTDLEPGAKFRWRISAATLDSEVKEFAEPERLAWSARATGIDAYHAWLIERRPDGCRVLTEETQNGWVARLNNLLRPNSVGEIHDAWLRGLLAKARA